MDRIKAVIFDMDGTLLDTLDDLAAAVNHALRLLGRDALPRERVRRFVGNGVKKLVERALFYTERGTETGEGVPDKFDDCLAAFAEYYKAHDGNTRLYDGVAEMLDALRARGIKIAVVTNKFDEGAQLLKAKFLPNVDCVVGTTDGIRPKPATDGVDRALGILGASAAEAVFVGDGETDIATARNAGLPVVAVTWGFRDRELLECLGPDIMIDSPDGLLPALAEEGLIEPPPPSERR